jgi:ankyrin repeat protein
METREISSSAAVDTIRLKGNEQFSAGNYEAAVSFYTQALKLEPRNTILLNNRIAAYRKMGCLEAAQKDGFDVFIIDPCNVKVCYHLAKICQEREHWDDGIEVIDKGLSRDPTNAALLTLKSNFCERLGFGPDGKKEITIATTRRRAGASNIITAIEAGNVSAFIKVLKANMDSINGRDKDGICPLMKCVKLGYELGHRAFEMLRILVEKGAHVDEGNNDGETPLMIASMGGFRDMVSLLLKNNASPDIQCNDGNTALIVAVVNGDHDRRDVINLLIEHKASIDIMCNNGYTALMQAANWGHGDVAKLLLSHGASVDLKNKNGDTALILAACNQGTNVFKNGTAVARFLVKHKAKLDVKNNKGQTALVAAVAHNNVELVKLLLATNAVDKDVKCPGGTPLILAAHYGHLEMARLLLKNKVQIDAVIDVDEDSGIGLTALTMAVMQGRIDIVKLLLKHKASVDLVAKNGPLALTFAVSEENVEMVMLLLQHKARVDIRSGIDQSNSTLGVACSIGNTEIIKILVEHNVFSFHTDEELKQFKLYFGGKSVDAPYDHAPTVELFNEELRRRKGPSVDEIRLKGNEQFAAKNFKASITFYTDALQKSPGNATILCNRCAAYINLKQYAEAESDALAALRSDPSYVKAYFRLANICKDQKRFKQGVGFAEQGLKKDPQNASLLALKAECNKEIDFLVPKEPKAISTAPPPGATVKIKTSTNRHVTGPNPLTKKEQEDALLKFSMEAYEKYPDAARNAFEFDTGVHYIGESTRKVDSSMNVLGEKMEGDWTPGAGGGNPRDAQNHIGRLREADGRVSVNDANALDYTLNHAHLSGRLGMDVELYHYRGRGMKTTKKFVLFGTLNLLYIIKGYKGGGTDDVEAFTNALNRTEPGFGIQAIDGRNRHDDFPLMEAVILKSKKIVKVLANRGAMLDQVNNEGHTSLEIAARGGDVEIVKILLESNATISSTLMDWYDRKCKSKGKEKNKNSKNGNAASLLKLFACELVWRRRKHFIIFLSWLTRLDRAGLIKTLGISAEPCPGGLCNILRIQGISKLIASYL